MNETIAGAKQATSNSIVLSSVAAMELADRLRQAAAVCENAGGRNLAGDLVGWADRLCAMAADKSDAFKCTEMWLG